MQFCHTIASFLLDCLVNWKTLSNSTTQHAQKKWRKINQNVKKEIFFFVLDGVHFCCFSSIRAASLCCSAFIHYSIERDLSSCLPFALRATEFVRLACFSSFTVFCVCRGKFLFLYLSPKPSGSKAELDNEKDKINFEPPARTMPNSRTRQNNGFTR